MKYRKDADAYRIPKDKEGHPCTETEQKQEKKIDIMTVFMVLILCQEGESFTKGAPLRPLGIQSCKGSFFSNGFFK